MKNDYKLIRIWGKQLGSYPSYIDSQVEQARADGAPQNAIYKSGAISPSEKGRWHTLDGVKSPETLRRIIYDLLSQFGEQTEETKMDKEMLKRYLGNPAVCPFCGSEDLEAGRLDVDGSAAFSRVKCNSCKKVWVDQYTLVNAEVE